MSGLFPWKLARPGAIAHNMAMDEQPAPPRRPRPPQDVPAGAPRVRRPPSKPVSRESRFIGYLVLGFGVLAVIAVLVLAFAGNDDTAPAAPGATTAANGPAAAPAKPVAAEDLALGITNPPASRSAPVTDLFFTRDPNFRVAGMEGDWQSAIGRYTAVLQIRKNVYQLILASPDPAAPRFYSSGTYISREDVIMLYPRNDWPPPAPPKGRAISYSKLTRAPFPVIARFDGGSMLWQNVPREEKRVMAPYRSPLFMSEDVAVATWKKLR